MEILTRTLLVLNYHPFPLYLMLQVDLRTITRYDLLKSKFGAQITTKICDIVEMHMWQSRVEIKHYSVAYFARIASFEAL